MSSELLFAVTVTMNNSTQYAVGWGTLSLITAGLAQSKGRSGLVWFFLSMLLGPLATFLVVILNPVKKAA